MTSFIEDKISQKFNRSALTYDQHCRVQNRVAQRAIELLLSHKSAFQKISDFACGTGESTKKLIKNISFEQGYGIDFAEKLIDRAKSKLRFCHQFSWIVSNFESYIAELNELDFIFCNMGLQWASNYSSTLQLWRRYLNVRGMILFSVPLNGNFPEIKKCYKSHFSSHHEVLSMLLENGWQVIEESVLLLEENFNTSLHALKSLKLTGTNFSSARLENARGLLAMKPSEFFVDNQNTKLTYKIGIYLVRKHE